MIPLLLAARKIAPSTADVLGREGLRSLCSIPLIARGVALGTLNVGSLREEFFTAEDLQFYSQVGGQVAIALDNECVVCQNTRFGEGPAARVDEEFYAHVRQWRTWPGYSAEERTAADFAQRFAADHTGLRDDDEFWARCREQFTDELLADLALSCALWLGMGRVLRTLDIGQACKLTV